MTQDDIIRMAREASRYASNQTGDSFEWQGIRDERFASLVAAAEREACARIAETKGGYTHLPTGVQICGSKAAAELRRLHAVNAELLAALRLIAATDPVDAALDPQRAVRVARAAIAKAEGGKA
jgi:hypothetical protein